VLSEVVLVPFACIRETLLSARSTSTGETPEYEYDSSPDEKLLFHFMMALSS
jgi:hypothetical protein